jgi:hypothetical protein
MEFPDDVLQIIRAFAKPKWTRDDWRTCKRKEAEIIWQYERFIRYVRTVVFYQHDLLDETDQWTLYGAAYLLFTLKHILWTVDYIDLLPIRRECTQDYLNRYRDFVFVPDFTAEHLLMHMRKLTI